MALDFGAMEAALAAWLSTATGLTATESDGVAARIVPRNEKVPQPPLPYLTYFLPLPNQVGGPDELRKRYDSGAGAGHEVVIETFGDREFVCGVQAFSEAAVGGADIDGRFTARAYLSRALSALALPSVQAALQTAGLAFVAVETAQDFSARLGAVGQGRAALDVRFRCIDVATDATGYIATVTTPDLPGPPL